MDLHSSNPCCSRVNYMVLLTCTIHWRGLTLQDTYIWFPEDSTYDGGYDTCFNMQLRSKWSLHDNLRKLLSITDKTAFTSALKSSRTFHIKVYTGHQSWWYYLMSLLNFNSDKAQGQQLSVKMALREQRRRLLNEQNTKRRWHRFLIGGQRAATGTQDPLNLM